MVSLREKAQIWLKLRREQQYSLVTTESENNQTPDEASCPNCNKKSVYANTAISIVVILLLLGLLKAFVYSKALPAPIVSLNCIRPPRRREWRELAPSERENFVQAVVCLSTIPSRWRDNGTIYDDFTFLHGGIGSWSHRSASFLPWHRFTLHLWEKALGDHCGFKGQIPYWDWSLDWMDLSQSSIWDNATGFGGDGDPNSPITVGEGRCVNDGPFSHLRPIMYNHTYSRHCLSRGFRDGERIGHLPDTPFSPETIGRIVRKPNYQKLRESIEYNLHNVMHSAIAGDFLALTAANDPIFFVHHTQLDRLWWQWQQQDLSNRHKEYEGKHMFNSTGPAKVNDMLLYGGFAEDIPVSKVMSTESGFLCYRY